MGRKDSHPQTERAPVKQAPYCWFSAFSGSFLGRGDLDAMCLRLGLLGASHLHGEDTGLVGGSDTLRVDVEAEVPATAGLETAKPFSPSFRPRPPLTVSSEPSSSTSFSGSRPGAMNSRTMRWSSMRAETCPVAARTFSVRLERLRNSGA